MVSPQFRDAKNLPHLQNNLLEHAKKKALNLMKIRKGLMFMLHYKTYAVLLAGFCLCSPILNAQTNRKVFVVDKVSQTASVQDYGSVTKSRESEHHSAPVVMAEFMKRCPNISFTENREDAELVLKTQQGGSTLSNLKGDILYVSPAKSLSNMVRDVCTYIGAH